MVSGVTKELVEKLVKEPIKSFEISAGSAVGDNVAGELKCITVTTAQGKTINLVHKTVPQDPHGKAFVVESGVFRKENEFYSELAPKLIDFAKSRKLADSSLPIPKFFGGFNNDADDYISLEDVRPLGFIMPNKFVGLTLAETSLILRELARFHALTYSFLRHEGEQFFDTHEQIGKNLWKQPDKQIEMSFIMQKVFENSVELVSRSEPELAKRLEAKFGGSKCIDYLRKTGDGTDVKYFPCIIHGDIWMNNTMIRYNKEGAPVEVKLIDFQQIRRGNIFEDLQYFLYTSTTPEFRKDHLYTVLGQYHDAFVQTMKELDVPLPINFSRGFLIDSIDDCRLPVYTYMSFAIPLQLGEKPNLSFGGPPEGAPHGDGNGAPAPAGPPQDAPAGPPPAFDMNSIPVEFRAQMFAGQLREMMERSERAVTRLLDLTREIRDLKLL